MSLIIANLGGQVNKGLIKICAYYKLYDFFYILFDIVHCLMSYKNFSFLKPAFNECLLE